MAQHLFVSFYLAMSESFEVGTSFEKGSNLLSFLSTSSQTRFDGLLAMEDVGRKIDGLITTSDSAWLKTDPVNRNKEAYGVLFNQSPSRVEPPVTAIRLTH